MKHVAVGIPMYTMKSRSVSALIAALFGTPGVNFSLLVVEGAYIHASRTQLVCKAREYKADYLFFMDHDVVYPADTLCRLLAHDKDIVFGKYNKRSHPPESTVMGLDGNMVNTFPSNIFSCSSGPAGCMLIKMSVFDRISQPWFDIIYDESGIVKETEDAWFCHQALAAGLVVWCDPTFQVDHYGEARY